MTSPTKPSCPDGARLIPVLNRGTVVYAIIDDADHYLVKNYSWRLDEASRTCRYAVAVSKLKTGPATVAMHRIICGTPDGMLTDHINGDTLDNRRANLRPVTHQQNAVNRRPATPEERKSHKGLKGIQWNSRTGWTASIRCNGVTYQLGRFPTRADAAIAYDHASRELHGEHAYLNFPGDGEEIAGGDA